MIVIGVDAHKRTHTLVALDAATGSVRGHRTTPATDAGALDALRFVAEIDEGRVWGRWRTAATSPRTWSARCWLQASG